MDKSGVRQLAVIDRQTGNRLIGLLTMVTSCALTRKLLLKQAIWIER
jgi:hypothetical protein